MKPVISYCGIGKSRTYNPHHARREIQSDLFHRLTLGYTDHFKYPYDIFGLCPAYHGHKCTFATVASTVSDHRI